MKSGSILQATSGARTEKDVAITEDDSPGASATVAHALSPTYPAIAEYGRYEILGRLAAGGMAEVFLAREKGQHNALRHVAIKRILPQIADDDTFVEMFLDEARLAIQLNHPSICHIYDFGEEENSYFLAMEWVNGVPFGTLVARAREFGGLPVAVAVKVIGHVAEALHHAHQARDNLGRPMNIVHRDVSPQNIMVRFDGVVKLLDFGIAKNASQTSQTEAGVVKGKFSYMAPEQCLGHPIDARTDIFALGSCLYEGLTGWPAFRQKSDLDTMRAIVHEAPVAIETLRPDVPSTLLAIVDRAMAKDPDHRFQTAGDLYVALERFLATEGEFVRSMHIAQYVDALMPEEAAAGPLVGSSAATKFTGAKGGGRPDDNELGKGDAGLDSADVKALGGSWNDVGGARASARAAATVSPMVDRAKVSERPNTRRTARPEPIPAPDLVRPAWMQEDGPTEQMDKAAIAAALAAINDRRLREENFPRHPDPAHRKDASATSASGAATEEPHPTPKNTGGDGPRSAPTASEAPARRTSANESTKPVAVGQHRGRRLGLLGTPWWFLGGSLILCAVVGTALGAWYSAAIPGSERVVGVAPRTTPTNRADHIQGTEGIKEHSTNDAVEAQAVEAAPAPTNTGATVAEAAPEVAAAPAEGDASREADDGPAEATPSPPMGRLTLVTRPRAVVYVAGARLGATPLRGRALPAGEHTVELRLPGGRRLERTIEVPANQNRRVFLRLR